MTVTDHRTSLSLILVEGHIIAQGITGKVELNGIEEEEVGNHSESEEDSSESSTDEEKDLDVTE